MKTLQQLYDQKVRLYRAINDRARRRAAIAHPETGGHPGLIHNWGNNEARQIWRDAEQRAERMLRAFERRFYLLEHELHKGIMSPGWCGHCAAERQPRRQLGLAR